MMIRMRAYDREEQRFLGFEEVKKSLTFADLKTPAISLHVLQVAMIKMGKRFLKATLSRFLASREA